MERLYDIVGFIIISGESIILIPIFILAYYYPEYYKIVGYNLKTYLPLSILMPGIQGYCILRSLKLWDKVLTPLGDSNTKALYDWSGYWKLKYRVVATLTICIISTIASIIIWLLSEKFSNITLGIVFVSLLAIPVVSLFCEQLAAIRVRELLDRYS
jgi:hypothetical protein